MDTKKVKLTVAILVVVLAIVGTYFYKNNRAIPKEEISDSTQVVEVSPSETGISEEIFFDTEEVHTVNTPLKKILENIEKADNGDKIGKYEGKQLYVFKYPQLTSKPIIYSDSVVKVVYDDYLCVKYEPEKDNEDYILIVYYFDSNNMWEAWYKYIIAKNIKEADILAQQEKDNGYAVWIDGLVVMVGEQFDEKTVTRDEFVGQYQYPEEIILKE